MPYSILQNCISFFFHPITAYYYRYKKDSAFHLLLSCENTLKLPLDFFDLYASIMVYSSEILDRIE